MNYVVRYLNRTYLAIEYFAKVLLLSVIVIVLFEACASHMSNESTSSSVQPDTKLPKAGAINTGLVFRGRNVNSALSSSLVGVQNEFLSYGLYANRGQSEVFNILPDFSYAGYMGGGVALPEYDSISEIKVLKPVEGDNLAQIQTAISHIEALQPDSRGIRGAVLLMPGTYEISDALVIDVSGIVLRGSGQGEGGTRIVATTTKPDKRESVIELGRGKKRNLEADVGPKLAANPAKTLIADRYVPVGATTIQLESTEGYVIGDEIAVVRTPNAYWLGEHGVNTRRFGWDPETYVITYTRKVVAIENNYLTIDIPLVDTIERRFGGGRVQRIDTSARVRQVGIENLRLETLYRNNLSDLNRAFFGISLVGVEHSWVRDVTVSLVSHGYNIINASRFNTLQDVAYADPNFQVRGGRNYGFIVNDGEMNLFQRCYGRKGRHTFVTGSRVAGPNVYLDCTATQSDSDSGPHHRWATGILYDNTQGDALNVQNRMRSGTGHGWAGAQNMFWNTDHKSNIVEAPPHAMNWAVGIHGKVKDGKRVNEPDGIIKSLNKRVWPRSLYLQQLEERLGEQAVKNVTIEAQRKGNIWNLLKSWRGEYRLSDK